MIIIEARVIEIYGSSSSSSSSVDGAVGQEHALYNIEAMPALFSKRT